MILNSRATRELKFATLYTHVVDCSMHCIKFSWLESRYECVYVSVKKPQVSTRSEPPFKFLFPIILSNVQQPYCLKGRHWHSRLSLIFLKTTRLFFQQQMALVAKFRGLMDHPAGPKTIFFWAPACKWVCHHKELVQLRPQAVMTCHSNEPNLPSF